MGYEIQFWDLTQIYFKNKFYVSYNDDSITEIKTYKLLSSLIKQQDLRKTVFITDITYSGKVLKLFRLLTKHRCFLIYFSKTPVVLSSIGSSSEVKILRIRTLFVKAFSLKELRRYFLNIISTYFKISGLIKPYDIIFTIGSFGIRTVGRGWFIDQKRSKIVPINSFDYDLFLKRKSEIQIVKNYCVFLDQYYPFHPDFIVSEHNSINPKVYYDSLNKLFDEIKKKFKMDVVIAAHPKAEKYKSKNYFKNNHFYFNKSIDLVKNAQFVIAHNSASISLAVLYYKPLIFLTSNDIKKMLPGSYANIVTFSEVLKSTLINMDNYNVDDININHNFESYRDFKYKYLTSPISENTLSSEIIELEFSQL
jgi:hypothetical protein